MVKQQRINAVNQIANSIQLQTADQLKLERVGITQEEIANKSDD